MKKIVATVLAMVMALALCTTAFAATAKTVEAKATMDTSTGVQEENNVTATYVKAVAAKLNKDGEQTNTANIAHYVVGDVTYVAVSKLADADLVLYNDWDDEEQEASNVLLYLAEAVVKYTGTGKVFTNFGDTCGKFDFDYESGETYYTSTAKGDDKLYVADEDGDVALMVSGKLVNMNALDADVTLTVEHSAVPTIVDGEITGYTCSVCKLSGVKAANYASIPEDVQVITGNWYFPVSASSTTTDTTATSPKTFDAGIAMYVGMALTSVAGSAVVIGKKKEF